jgi:hypothetical protein
MGGKGQLGLGRIFVFWAPLALTWLMMAAEGPILAAIVARLADPKPNLAAHGVAFAIAILVESPIIMLMSASTALAGNRAAYRKLRVFTWWLNGGITFVMAVLLVTPAMGYITRELIGLPAEVARLTVNALLILLPWPAAIGFRRFYQGLLIRAGMTRRVAYGTVIRLVAIVGASFSLFLVWDELPGAYIAAVAMSFAVVLESVATRLMAGQVVRRLLAGELIGPASRDDLTYREITVFYYPLAITSVVALAVHPLVSFFLGHSRFALESLAVMPVVGSLTFLFRALGLSFQEAAIALLGERNEHFAALRRFGVLLGLAATGGLALIAFTPLSGIWFRQVSALGPGLAELAEVPAMLMVPIPLLSVMLSLQRAIMVKSGRTGPVSWATLVEVGVVAGMLALGIHGMGMIGAVVAAMALVIGRCAGTLYLARPCALALGGRK